MTVPPEQVKPQHVTLRLEENLLDELRKCAERNDRSLSAEVRIAVRQYLNGELSKGDGA